MFANKEISHKFRGPTRSKNARHLLVWVYHQLCVHILYAFWAYCTQCLCLFCTAKASRRPPLHYGVSSLLKTSPMRQSQKVAHAWCVMRTWPRFATERKKKNHAGISTRAFSLESPSNKTYVKPIRYVLDQLDEWQLIWYGSKVPTERIMWIEIYAHCFLL